VIALVAAALVSNPWPVLSVAGLLYLLVIPFSILSYGRVRRQRAALTGSALPAGDSAPTA